MQRVENMEQNHYISKTIAYVSISKLLGEFIDPKYFNLEPEQTLDLAPASYFDYMVLPLLHDDEQFNLHTFLLGYFEGDTDKVAAFKYAMDKISVYEDVVEMIMLLKMVSDQCKYSGFDAKVKLCVYYYMQMKKLKELHLESNKLQIQLHDQKINLINRGMQNHALGNVGSEMLLEKIDLFHKKSDSKINLLNCINLLYKKDGLAY